MKAMCGAGGSKFGDTRGCLVVIMVLLAALTIVIVYSLISKFS